MSPIYVRILIVVYRNQESNVRWNEEKSHNFPVRNGTGQGRVYAAIAYCMYMEEMFALLRRRRTGCWVRGEYRGIFGYSDDNFALAPSISALRDMLKTISDYAQEHNLRFSTDPNPKKCKTKVMAFTKKPRPLPSVSLGPVTLPWVDVCKHLGNTIKNVIDGGEEDMRIK